MKKLSLISLVLLLFAALPVSAQKQADLLVGIWQSCEWAENLEQPSNEKDLQPSFIWKVINKDGTFSQFMVGNKEGMCSIVQEGTYKVNPDNTFTEHIEKHGFDAKMIGFNSVVRYNFINDDILQISFKLEGHPGEFKEIWKRVKLFDLVKK